ncbi:MAG: hypothetical protein IPK01_13095 [Acidobacteria bacterium]|nr:hypothetical protein [Acidobacteriota bacterium]
MDVISEIKLGLADEWLPAIYENKVRPGRTRSVHIDVPVRENAAEIQYTLLESELKVSKRRFACPDLAAARYMRIFCEDRIDGFRTAIRHHQTSPLADELETAWHRALLLSEEKSQTLSEKARKRAQSTGQSG